MGFTGTCRRAEDETVGRCELVAQLPEVPPVQCKISFDKLLRARASQSRRGSNNCESKASYARSRSV